MSTNTTERRSLVGADLRASQGDEFSIVARALTYNALSQPGVPFQGARERIAPGTFQSSLEAGDEILALVNHDASQILGRSRNGTLVVNDGPEALRFRVALNKDVQAHQDLHALVKAGTLSECSFGFIVEPGGDNWTEQVDEDGRSYQLRTVTHAKLLDLSVVASPAYSDGATVAQARNFRYVNLPSNTTADLRARLAAIDIDFRHREKLHELEMQIAADDRRAAVRPAQNPPTPDECYQRALDDFAAGRFSILGVSDSFIYALSNDDDDSEEESCYRLQWQKFLDGAVRVIGEAKRLRIEDVASAAPRFIDKAFELRVQERLALKTKMRSLAGIGSF